MVTSEKSANKAGVVRTIAKSDHWRSRLDAQMSTHLMKGDFNGPAQPSGFHKNLLARPNRITIDASGGNLSASSTLYRFINAQNQWLVSWNKQANQQPQQQATELSTRPFGTTRARDDSSGIACRPSIPSRARWQPQFALQEPGSLLSAALWPIPTFVRSRPPQTGATLV